MQNKRPDPSVLANSIIYATGQKFKALIWTQDIDFKSLESVKYYPKKPYNTKY